MGTRIGGGLIGLLVCLLLQPPWAGAAHHSEFVILLHGLARSKKTMTKLQENLTRHGYTVLNVGYASRTKTVEAIAADELSAAIADAVNRGAQKLHFVTHSMGGIILRYHLLHHPLPALGRVVMLSPPNQGSEVVDVFKDNFLFKWLNGPAGRQLGTSSDSLPIQMGAVDFDLGVITGDRSINWFLSCLIPGPDDGKVSVERAKIAGMNDFIVLHATHPFIMKNKAAISQVIAFLKNGQFTRP